jgi:malonyl CoA-acyl carrier protein transacylase
VTQQKECACKHLESTKDVQSHIAEACRKTGSKISVGCVNSPKNVTVTGDIAGIEALREDMEEMGIFARQLPVGVA